MRRRIAAAPLVRVFAVAVLVMGAACERASAEESIFSITFLGLREETADARARALGVSGVALGDQQTALSLNPGSFAKLDRMTLSLVGGAGTRTSTDGRLEHEDSDATFPHLRAALPLPGELVFSAGFIALRNFRAGFFTPSETVGPYSYRDAFERSGSLYEVPLGIARSLHPRLHLGVTLDLILGTVNEAWTTSGDSLLALRTRRRDGMDGATVTVGAVVEPFGWLRLGATWSPEASLDVETRTTIEDGRIVSSSNALRTEISRSKTDYPAVARAGVMAHYGTKLLVTADATMRDWSSWDGELYGAPAVGTEWLVGGGLEARPHGSLAGRRLAYRVGASHSQWPQEMAGNTVLEYAVHGGLGYDLREGFGRLDLTLGYTRAGSLARNGMEETRWSFLLSLTGQEIWRRKSPRTK
jgi:hypothetical protein